MLSSRKPLTGSDRDDQSRYASMPHRPSFSARLSGFAQAGLSSGSSMARLSGFYKSQRVLPMAPRRTIDGPMLPDMPTQTLRRALTVRDRVTQVKLKSKNTERRLWHLASRKSLQPTVGDSLKSKRWKRASSVFLGRGSLTLQIGRRQSLIRRSEEMKAHQEMIGIFNLRQTKRPSFRRRSTSPSFSNAALWDVIHPGAALLKAWHSLILLLLLYEAVYIPFTIGIGPDLRGTPWQTFHYVVDVLFALDVLVTFNIAYYEHDPRDEQRTLTLKYSSSISAKDKYLVRSRSRIACHYASSWLLLDLLAAIPIDWIETLLHIRMADVQDAVLLKAARIPRVLGILRLAKALKTDGPLWWWLEFSTGSVLTRLVRLILIVMYMDHICACIWYAIASAPGGWGDLHFDPTSLHYTYARCYYNCMMALLGQDILPTSLNEMIFLTFVSIAGSVAMATVYGDVAIVVSSLYANSTKYREKMEDVYESMQHLGLPQEVQQRVHLYYTYLWQQYHTLDGRSAPFVSELSTNLQREIMLYLNAKMIRSVPLMQECSPEVVQEIVLQLETRVYMPEDFIINIGETGFEMFFVQRGECEVLIEANPPCRDKRVIKLITVGDYFGEIALLMDCRRTACVRAKTFCVLCVLHRTGFRQIIARHKDDRQKLESLIMEKYKNDAVKPDMAKTTSHRPAAAPVAAPSVHRPTHLPQHSTGDRHGMGTDKAALRMLYDATTCLHDVTSRINKMEQSIEKLTKAVRLMTTATQETPASTRYPKAVTRHTMLPSRGQAMQRVDEVPSATRVAGDLMVTDLDGSIRHHKRRYTVIQQADTVAPTEAVKPMTTEAIAVAPAGRRLTAPANQVDVFHDEATLREQIFSNLDRVERALLEDARETKQSSSQTSEERALI
ncbi:hypothetical protein SDRG_02720 [Saprolegnia diclina VS20]|uniref:Cyclic nucleotide-binding domain-containing protein n=1 Tax=Saprolegnia diclina (strain VS20) TaxID=1156394 RepID=T0R187_SAPDV|nr:hypothetical protein SDRG_02720 [Saprolegnia diclina VS20]EQC40065.1 hypothetical protein SDRG_02720 [Saprolegnia diclina VS20]|eukprot:XP_008606539.1 hypothetical protein SDRG_02720 [Saprolegnia diclina VS20]